MSLFETRSGANATSLPGPTPLLPLTSALSRRAALFGAVTVAGCTAAALPAKAGTSALSANDVRLVAIEGELATLDRFVEAYPPIGLDDEENHPTYFRAIDGFCPLEDEMAALPADTMAGVLAKVRAFMVPTCHETDNSIASSIATDLARLHGIEVAA